MPKGAKEGESRISVRDLRFIKSSPYQNITSVEENPKILDRTEKDWLRLSFLAEVS